jgi:hypothetical protein
MVSENFITLALNPQVELPDRVMVTVARYVTRMNMEIRRVHRVSESCYKLLCRNHKLKAKVFVELRDGEWQFKVSRISLLN